MLKYTRTAIGLLTRQYRSVLHKCWMINVGLWALGAAAIMVPSDAEAGKLCYNNGGSVYYVNSDNCPTVHSEYSELADSGLLNQVSTGFVSITGRQITGGSYTYSSVPTVTIGNSAYFSLGDTEMVNEISNSVSSSSTDNQLVTAKAVYDAISSNMLIGDEFEDLLYGFNTKSYTSGDTVIKKVGAELRGLTDNLYSTQDWVGQQGYMTFEEVRDTIGHFVTEDMSGGWMEQYYPQVDGGFHYADDYTSMMQWLDAMDEALYGVANAGYATQDWVGQQGFLTSHQSIKTINNKTITGSGNVNLTYSDVGAAAATHYHDDRYYTESEIDNKLSGKSNTGHTHDDRYYTESEINTQFTNYYTKLDSSREDDEMSFIANNNITIIKGSGVANASVQSASIAVAAIVLPLDLYKQNKPTDNDMNNSANTLAAAADKVPAMHSPQHTTLWGTSLIFRRKNKEVADNLLNNSRRTAREEILHFVQNDRISFTIANDNSTTTTIIQHAA